MIKKMTILRLIKILFVVFSISIIGLLSIPVSARDNAAPQAAVLREGNDFATLELRDPWDMDSFSDISQGFNTFGTSHNFYNFKIENGVFSGITGSISSSYYVLYPGDFYGVHIEKTGYLQPIDSSKYKCFYIAQYVDPSPTSYQVVSWVKDMSLSSGGFAGGMEVDSGNWRLNSYNLSNQLQAGINWSTSDWMGLYLTPTNQANKYFAVDWVRLTDCTEVNHTLTNLPSDSDSLWFDTGSHEILVAGLLSQKIINGQFTLDVQGFQPGTYAINVKNASGKTVQQSSLTIQPAPIPTFVNPSPIIGDDYATLAGNPWDMQDNQDVIDADCTSYAIINGILDLYTLPASSQPRYCIGSGADEADPKIYLNTPTADDITQYRYLSFRHNIDGPWAQPAKGMIVRWIWEMSGLASKDCKYVSQEIALDVGWKTYWVDLYDIWNGSPVEVGGLNASSCPWPVQWKTQPGSLSQFRLDPDENITSSIMHQEFDWIRLTKVPSVMKGLPFPIQVSMNKSPDAIRSITFYYTADVSQLTQNLANGSFVNSKLNQTDLVMTQVETANPIFLPMALNKYTPPVELPPVENEIQFLWDTASVPPGEYFICAVTSDGYNQTTFCSQSPVQVLP